MAIPKIKLSINPKSFNEIYLHSLKYNDAEKYPSIEKVYFGGSGSGKSESISRLEIVKDFLSVKGTNAIIIMEHSTVIRKVAFPLIKKVLNEYLKEHRDKVVHIQEREMRFINKINGNEIICTGLEDTEDLKGITFEHGILTTAWLEEGTALTRDVWKVLRQRMRGTLPPGVQFKKILSYNPIEEDNWAYADFVKDIKQRENFREEGPEAYLGNRYWVYDRRLELLNDDGTKKEIVVPVMVLKTNCEDNKFVDDVYKAELRNEEDPYLRDIYYYGNPGVKKDQQAVISYPRAMRCTESRLEDEAEDILGLGCDVAGDGEDKMVFKARYGPNELELLPEEMEFDSNSTTEFARHITMVGKRLSREIEKRLGCTPTVMCNIDKTGVGKGTYDTMEDIKVAEDLHNWTINGVDFGGRANDPDLYKNKATEMYFNIRNMVNNEEIYLINHTETLTQLCTRHYETIMEKDGTKYLLEPKKRYKKRRRCGSPDFGDAEALAFYEPKGSNVWVL